MSGCALFLLPDWWHALAALCWLCSAPGVACAILYALLRLSGVIRIDSAGLQVGALSCRGRVAVSAGSIYCRFRGLCERELAVWLALKSLACGGSAGEGVVDVEVETIAL